MVAMGKDVGHELKVKADPGFFYSLHWKEQTTVCAFNCPLFWLETNSPSVERFVFCFLLSPNSAGALYQMLSNPIHICFLYCLFF
jgi:hypothetical protein